MRRAASARGPVPDPASPACFRPLASARSAAAVAALALLAGCATQTSAAVAPSAPGLGWGLLHGVIAPFAFVASLFRPDIAIYAVPNNGGWYDFGFILGIFVLGGGGASASR